MADDIKSISEHLLEFKNLLIKIFGVWLLTTIGSSFFSQVLIEIFTKPLSQINLSLNFFSPTDSLFFVIKIVSISGLLIGSPVIFWLLWKYLSKALEQKEKQFLFNYFFGALVLTITAIVYSYFYLIPTSLKFLIEFTPKNSVVILSASEYSSFVLSMFLAITLVFQTPIIVMSLVKTNLVKIETFKTKRKEIYFAILVLTAAFGSPDVFTWMISSVPVFILFEGSLILAQKSVKKPKEL